MVDCRLCRNMYTIYRSEIDGKENQHVCILRELFIDKEYLTNGPCEDYVDLDGYDPRE